MFSLVFVLFISTCFSTSIFDPRVYNYYFYINTNPDLREANLFSKEQAATHWESHGIHEGRQACGSFHSVQYLNNYPSLKQKFGTNYTAAILYYLNTGYYSTNESLGYTIGGGSGRYTISNLFSTSHANTITNNSNNAIYISGSDRTAIAIDSLVWNNIEFINSWDHGRELQQAVTTNDGECYNPTEAGSGNGDGITATSSSAVLSVACNETTLTTSVLPAYWMVPGSSESGCGAAINQDKVSNWTMSKSVSIGYDGIDNVVHFVNDVYVPIDLTNASSSNGIGTQIEAPTAYLNANFDSFYCIDFENGKDLNGNLSEIVISNKVGGSAGVLKINSSYVIIGMNDTNAAMGVMPKIYPQRGFALYNFLGLGYDSCKTSKWSIVTYHENIVAGSTLKFENWFCIGTLKDVHTCMSQLYQKMFNYL